MRQQARVFLIVVYHVGIAAGMGCSAGSWLAVLVAVGAGESPAGGPCSPPQAARERRRESRTTPTHTRKAGFSKFAQDSAHWRHWELLRPDWDWSCPVSEGVLMPRPPGNTRPPLPGRRLGAQYILPAYWKISTGPRSLTPAVRRRSLPGPGPCPPFPSAR